MNKERELLKSCLALINDDDLAYEIKEVLDKNYKVLLYVWNCDRSVMNYLNDLDYEDKEIVEVSDVKEMVKDFSDSGFDVILRKVETEEMDYIIFLDGKGKFFHR